MTETTRRGPWWKTSAGQTWLILSVIALVIGGGLVWSRVNAAREQAARVDELYCTLSGVSPFDRGPETGRTCADLLYGD